MAMLMIFFVAMSVFAVVALIAYLINPRRQ
jgi:hypothetical protein